MFVRPYRVKSSVQLKTSEKKKFRHLVEECFSQNEGIMALLPNKANVINTKLLPHNDGLGMIQIHSIEKEPLFLTMERDNVPIPTIHTLWKVPDLLPRVTMPYNVLDKFLGGADLMLPGIFPESLPPSWEAGDIVAVCVPNNGAPVAVGIWGVSRAQAIANRMKGKGIYIYQVYQDQLWHNGTKDKLPTLPPPVYSHAEESEQTDENTPGEVAVPTEGGEGATQDTDPELPGVAEIAEALESADIEPSKDELMLEACYRALKTSLGKTELPILTSTFYSKHVRVCCSAPVEIKETTFKKVSVLLKELEKDGLIVVKEQKKGVFHITEARREHPKLRGITKLEKEADKEEEEEEDNVAVVEAFLCNAAVTPLFSKYGYKKGDILLRKNLRESITDYIKRNNMSSETQKGLVTLDPLLSTVMSTRQTTAKWNEIMCKMESNCGKCFVISLPDKFPITVKGKLPPIQFKIEKRTGNKKVTIISNFDIFGIDAKELAQKLQHLMSSSASVVPGVKSNNVLCQGDARKAAIKLFLDVYMIPKKYVSSG